MWNSAWSRNVNMAARYMGCTLYVKNYKHGNDVNSEVVIDMFILCSNYIYIYLFINCN
jgi:hypothetical protein